MKWCWTSLLVLGWAFPAPAQAQRVVEFGPLAVATFADRDFAGGGGFLAVRSSHSRVLAGVLAGARGGGLAGRGELVGHFLLQPSTTGLSPYAGGGVAVVTGDGTDGYVVLVAGVESSPALPSGWAVEIGLGGGVRLGVAWHWRRAR